MSNTEITGLATLNTWTTTETAFAGWLALLAACRAGYVPSIRHPRLRAAVCKAGCRVF